MDRLGASVRSMGLVAASAVAGSPAFRYREVDPWGEDRRPDMVRRWRAGSDDGRTYLVVAAPPVRGSLPGIFVAAEQAGLVINGMPEEIVDEEFGAALRYPATTLVATDAPRQGEPSPPLRRPVDQLDLREPQRSRRPSSRRS